MYEVLAFAMRYWFLFLIAVIIWRSIRWLKKDGRKSARLHRRLPDAGHVGEWVIISSGESKLKAGHVLPISREGWLGSAGACDVCVRDRGIPARAARFFLKRDGLHLLPQKRDLLIVDGELVQREAVLRHGATLQAGNTVLQLRMFAGVMLEGETMPQMPLPEPILWQEESVDFQDDVPVTELPPERITLPVPNMRLRFDRKKRKEKRRNREA